MSSKDLETQQDIEGTESEHRVRTLNDRGTELYHTQREKHTDTLKTLWGNLVSILQGVQGTERQASSLHHLEELIRQTYQKYIRQYELYCEFLKSTRTEESFKDLDEYKALFDQHSLKVRNSLIIVRRMCDEILESTSTVSNKSNRSTVSETSSIARRKRAEAQAAKAKLAFAEQQAMLLKEAARADQKKAELQADLGLLATRQAAAVAEAEACALEEDEIETRNVVDLLPDRAVDNKDRLRDFVNEQASLITKPEVTNNHRFGIVDSTADKYLSDATSISQTYERPKQGVQLPPWTLDFDNSRVHMPPQPSSVSIPQNISRNVQFNQKIPSMYSELPPERNVYEPTDNDNRSGEPVISTLNQNAPEYQPPTCQSIPVVLPTSTLNGINRYPSDMNPTADITKFLLRKDLLFSRLTNFSDRPESYNVWKASFKGVINELQVSDSEQLDLLVKWLGVESSKHAISIRASNANDPSRGVQRLWQRLDERYGSPEMMEASLKNKLANFPKLTNKDNKRLYELSDILSEIEYIKENPTYQNLLGYFDSSSGIKPIVSKLPYGLQEKWTNRAVKYVTQHNIPFPPFTEFSAFIREMSRVKNNPGFVYDSDLTTNPRVITGRQNNSRMDKISAHKIEVEQQPPRDSLDRCILHKTKHSLNDCRGFRSKSLEERKQLLKQNNICFKCCTSNTHKGRDCKVSLCCKECGNKYHATAMHVQRSDRPPNGLLSSSVVQEKGGEARSSDNSVVVSKLDSKCTEICVDSFNGKSCAKILPVNVYHKDNREKIIRMYAIIDDQSNRSLASSQFFDVFNVQEKPENYTLSTCSGKLLVSGRKAKDFVIESIRGDVRFDLPVLVECDQIPSNREEIPTPEVTLHHPHLNEISRNILPIDDNCEILLLIGRDLIEAHHVLHQIYGPPKTPYAQKLKLGWVIIGETCLDAQHTSINVNVKKTYLMSSGRATVMKPCENKFDISEPRSGMMKSHNSNESSVFVKTKDDDRLGMSYEDKLFMKQMDSEFVRDSHGSWVAPLPFRKPRQPLPNNRLQAVQRANSLDASLKNNKVKKEHFLKFMGKILDNNHAEVAGPLRADEECWYLPLFGIYHPKKPNQIRGVFNSSAQFNGMSLNKVLLSGPDMSNSLLGILLRFRKEMVAVTADIEHTFHCFIVREDHRNYLRFLWHSDNDFNKEIIEYRMRVHVFGNSPSPAVATLGLRKAAQAAQPEYGKHVTDFVNKDFYVDDGLISCSTAEQAIKIVKDTQGALMKYGNLRLHKIASNSSDVMSAFPTSDLATNLKDLDLEADDKPLQRSLGLSWDVNTDSFLFQLLFEDKPITRRGILSTVNSIFDPLGFLAPVTIYGKLLLRKIVSETVDWDQPLPTEIVHDWESWRDSLKVLETLRIPRTYVTYLSESISKELHVFADASEKAIAAVAYLRTVDTSSVSRLGFVLGKAKLAPTSGHTIPRLELCAAVLAVEIGQCVVDHLDIPLDAVKYYTDSKVVLGYVRNESRRFFVYVANRIDRIRKYSKPSQWNYVPTNCNPADLATRSVKAHEIHNSEWLLGPKQLINSNQDEHQECEFELVDPDDDREVRPTIGVRKTQVEVMSGSHIGTLRFTRFSNWRRLVNAITFLKRFVRSRGHRRSRSQETVLDFQDTEMFILRSVQLEVYKDEIDCIRQGQPIPRRSPIANLNPFIDEHGLLRVGGRIGNSDLILQEKKPLIVPGSHHIATLLVRHYHNQIKHQGRHFTNGAIRAAGLWITSVKRLVSSVIYKCVTCRKLRGKTEHQIMSDLPKDRIEPSPPFTNVGVDVFGPWVIVSRRTRGGQANSKRWAVLFTCLVTRAVHIELVDEMSSSAFINAARRFTSIRGTVKIYRSDRGTNFIGAVDDLKIDSINVEDGPLKKYLYDSGTVWIFNPPYSSHMGGAWERLIGITRRILDSMLLNTPGKSLTHDVLNTFMAEVSAIINSRPLVPVSTDPECPLILTPTMLLTQKTEYEFVANSLGDFNDHNMYKVEWKRVQALASVFWSRWKKEYLPLLQTRQKWTDNRRDINVGDVILLKDKNINRNSWPVGIVTKTFKSSDEHVRKAEVRIIVDGKPVIYTRPIVNMILLVEDNCV